MLQLRSYDNHNDRERTYIYILRRGPTEKVIEKQKNI